jgi:hypothetical protein
LLSLLLVLALLLLRLLFVLVLLLGVLLLRLLLVLALLLLSLLLVLVLLLLLGMLLLLSLLFVLALLLLLGMLLLLSLLLLGVLLLSLLLVLALLLLRLLLVLVLLLLSLLLVLVLLLLSLLLVLALLLLSLLLLLVLLCLLFRLGLLFLLRVGKSNASEKHEQQKCCADNCQSFHKRASHFSLSLATPIDCLVLTSSGKDDHSEGGWPGQAHSGCEIAFNLGCPVLARFWLGRGSYQDRILCRLPGDSNSFFSLPTVETVGYHLSRPRRWGCAGFAQRAESHSVG